MRVSLIIPLIGFAIGSVAQNDSLPLRSTNRDSSLSVWVDPEEMPPFPGGDVARISWMRKELNYPDDAREAGVVGTVWVKFIIGQDGTISDAHVVRGVHRTLDEEALRVVKAMPAWKPGRIGGRAVPVRFTMPIKFTLRDDPRKKKKLMR